MVYELYGFFFERGCFSLWFVEIFTCYFLKTMAKIGENSLRNPSLSSLHHRENYLINRLLNVSLNIRVKPSPLKLPSGHSGVVGAFLGLAILANAFATYFVTQEHYIYYWDWSYYWHKSQDLSTSLMHHPISALSSLISSVRSDDYNPLPVLPLVPFEWLFGTSRLSYILAITNVALLPSAFIMGLLAQRILPQKSPKPSFSPLVLATGSLLALNSLWAPMLRGLPDVIGILVIGCILLLHFAKPLSEQRLAYLVTTAILIMTKT